MVPRLLSLLAAGLGFLLPLTGAIAFILTQEFTLGFWFRLVSFLPSFSVYRAHAICQAVFQALGI